MYMPEHQPQIKLGIASDKARTPYVDIIIHKMLNFLLCSDPRIC